MDDDRNEVSCREKKNGAITEGCGENKKPEE